MALRLVDKKHRKQLSDPELSQMAEICLIALADLEIKANPQLSGGLGSLLPTLEADDEVKERLVSLLGKYALKKVNPRSARMRDEKLAWQGFLCSIRALELIPLFKQHAPNPKLTLIRFCKWLGEAIVDSNTQSKLIERHCPALVDCRPAPNSIRIFLALKKPPLYILLTRKKNKK